MGHRGRRARGGPGFFGSGGRDFPGSRRLGSADLQLLILVLLEQEAAHGYELIKTIEERSGGFYSPSPGVIYPALTFLEEVGYARSEQESTRKLYHITSEGRSHLGAHRATADAILDALARIGGRMMTCVRPLRASAISTAVHPTSFIEPVIRLSTRFIGSVVATPKRRVASPRFSIAPPTTFSVPDEHLLE
jgi:DNA-binding PadR family transcriptional regulator